MFLFDLVCIEMFCLDVILLLNKLRWSLCCAKLP